MDEQTKEVKGSQSVEAEKKEAAAAPLKRDESAAARVQASPTESPRTITPENETTQKSSEAEAADTAPAAAEKSASPVARSGRIRVAPRGDFRRIKPGLRARVRPHATESAKPGSEGEGAIPEKSEIAPERRYRDDRRPPADLHELLGEHLRLRAESADPKLRAQLMGSLLIKFASTGERFLFDWTTDKLDMGFREAANADCVMSISEQNFMRIVNGSLNPQIAILSDKINVSGKLSMAVYWFNLLAARSSAV